MDIHMYTPVYICIYIDICMSIYINKYIYIYIYIYMNMSQGKSIIALSWLKSFSINSTFSPVHIMSTGSYSFAALMHMSPTTSCTSMCTRLSLMCPINSSRFWEDDVHSRCHTFGEVMAADWVRSNWILNWVGLDWTGVGWVGLGWAG